jgi:hypothetical protein
VHGVIVPFLEDQGMSRNRLSYVLGGPSMKNRLEVRRQDFNSAFRPFGKADATSEALLSFEGGFLSVEVDELAAVVHASGEWQGRVRFSANVLRALAKVPPTEDPIIFEFAEGHLRIGTMLVGCHWETVSASFIQGLKNPDYLDLIALDRTLPRSEIRGKRLDRQIRAAQSVLAGRVAKAAKLLEVADIEEADLWHLVEQNIRARMVPKGE